MTLKIKRTTKARLNEVAAQKGLSEGSPFLITDEKRMAVIAIHSVNTNVYNQSPNEIITFQGSFHHRVVNPPTFYIASDQSQATYGNLSLFMSVPFNGTIQNLTVSAKRLM